MHEQWILTKSVLKHEIQSSCYSRMSEKRPRVFCDLSLLLCCANPLLLRQLLVRVTRTVSPDSTNSGIGDSRLSHLKPFSAIDICDVECHSLCAKAVHTLFEEIQVGSASSSVHWDLSR